MCIANSLAILMTTLMAYFRSLHSRMTYGCHWILFVPHPIASTKTPISPPADHFLTLRLPLGRGYRVGVFFISVGCRLSVAHSVIPAPRRPGQAGSFFFSMSWKWFELNSIEDSWCVFYYWVHFHWPTFPSCGAFFADRPLSRPLNLIIDEDSLKCLLSSSSLSSSSFPYSCMTFSNPDSS